VPAVRITRACRDASTCGRGVVVPPCPRVRCAEQDDPYSPAQPHRDVVNNKYSRSGRSCSRASVTQCHDRWLRPAREIRYGASCADGGDRLRGFRMVILSRQREGQRVPGSAGMVPGGSGQVARLPASIFDGCAQPFLRWAGTGCGRAGEFGRAAVAMAAQIPEPGLPVRCLMIGRPSGSAPPRRRRRYIAATPRRSGRARPTCRRPRTTGWG
jgi:hypothetical protein